jgi:hypothetical protein
MESTEFGNKKSTFNINTKIYLKEKTYSNDLIDLLIIEETKNDIFYIWDLYG